MSHAVYLGLGANLGEPIQQLQWAVKQQIGRAHV